MIGGGAVIPVSEPLASFTDLLNVDEMATVLGVSNRTIYRMVDREELPSVKVGHRIYFPKKQLIELLGL